MPNPPFYIYLSRFGLAHCGGATEKRSIYDPLWRKAIEQVILCLNSAYPFVMLVEEKIMSIDYNVSRSGLLGLCSDKKANDYDSFLHIVWLCSTYSE
jgi:hypothetical protein